MATGHLFADLYFLLSAFGDFSQVEFDPHAQVAATVYPLTASGASTAKSAKSTKSSTEMTAEDVAEL